MSRPGAGIVEVGAVLHAYRAAILAGDAQRAALSFADDAKLSHDAQPPVRGRAAIRDLLASFASFRVQSYELSAVTTLSTGTGVEQRGPYRQIVVTPEGQVIRFAGTFVAHWSRSAGGPWLITTMHTASGADSDTP